MEAEQIVDKRSKIYFCGSIRGVAPNLPLYQPVVNHMGEKHGDVLTKHVAFPDLEHKEMTDSEIFEHDYTHFKNSNIMVSEISQPSHGVGIELGWGMLRENYPVLAIYSNKSEFKISGLVGGCKNIEIIRYDPEDLKTLLEKIDEFFVRRAGK